MRTLKIRLALIFILAALASQALVSCATSQENSGGSFFFTKHKQDIPTFKNKSNPDAHMDISLALIDARQAKLSKLIHFLLYDGLSPKQYAEQVFARYKKEFQEYAEDIGEEHIQGWTYSEEHLVNAQGSYAVITKNFYGYSGGVHGSYRTTHYVIDMNAPDRLMLDDIIDKTGFAKLKPFVDRELRLYSQEVSGDPLPPNLPLWEGIYLEADFELKDFYPTESGLAFWWNVYELTPYAAGPVNVTVGWNELDGILNTKGSGLAKAFRK